MRLLVHQTLQHDLITQGFMLNQRTVLLGSENPELEPIFIMDALGTERL